MFQIVGTIVCFIVLVIGLVGRDKVQKRKKKEAELQEQQMRNESYLKGGSDDDDSLDMYGTEYDTPDGNADFYHDGE